MDEFIFVLLAGLVMISILLVAWGIPPEDEGVINVEMKNPFSIGMFSKDVARQTSFGDFEVSYAVGSEIIETKRNVNVIKKEKFSMSGEIEHNPDLVTGGFLTIYVKETNQEGNLVVKLNEKEVFNQKVTVGKVEIPLEKVDLQNYNIVEISISKSGWKFWVKPFYNLDKVDFGVNFYGNLEKTEEFQVYPEELRRFKSAEVSFKLKDYSGSGDLMISINNHRIYKGHPSLDFHQSFDQYDVGLTSGINSISFTAESGSSYNIGDSVLTIIREESATKSRSFDFTVGSSEYNDDLEGEISFYISNADYGGNLLVIITDTSGNKHPPEAIQSYSVNDTKTVSFDKDFVDTGINKVTFEASDGNFVISNLEIKAK